MKIEYMREFIAVAKYLNFSTAASKLYITQSALSRHISHIEEILDCKLLTRDTHHVLLTDEGRIFLDNASQIIKQYDEMVWRINNRKQEVLRIGFLNYTMNLYLTPYYEKIITNCPELQLQLYPSSSSGILENIFQSRIDIGIYMRVECPDEEKIRKDTESWRLALVKRSSKGISVCSTGLWQESWNKV